MTVKYFYLGHEIPIDTKPEDAPQTCRHCGKPPVMLPVLDSKLGRVEKPIDACIAPLVTALNSAGIYTRYCCCGHGRLDGKIYLHDGRTLVIRKNNNEQNEKDDENTQHSI